MGKYINETSKGPIQGSKTAAIVIDGGEQIKQPDSFIPNLICVVDNGIFDAAGYCYNEGEFKVFSKFDGRPKTWLIYPNAEKYAK